MNSRTVEGRGLCRLPLTRRQSERRGLAWIVGAFVICPCHLPVTLAVAATVLSGSAIGALMTSHQYIAGVIVSLVWVAATWRGFRYLRLASRSAR